LIAPNRLLTRTLRAGFNSLAVTGGAGLALFTAYKADEIDELLEDGMSQVDVDAEILRQWTHFAANAPRIERGFPRRTWTTWPAIFVTVMNERDDQRFIGSLMQYTSTDDERVERYGVVEEVAVGVYIYSENLDELDDLHLFCKHILRGATADLLKSGVTVCNLTSGQDIEANPLLPETVFVRGQIWEVKGPESYSVALGARVSNVYINLDAAEYTKPDGSTDTGGVEPE